MHAYGKFSLKRCEDDTADINVLLPDGVSLRIGPGSLVHLIAEELIDSTEAAVHAAVEFAESARSTKPKAGKKPETKDANG